MTTRFLILPEDKESKETWETTSSSDDVIDVVAVFEVGERTTPHYAATLLLEYIELIKSYPNFLNIIVVVVVVLFSSPFLLVAISLCPRVSMVAVAVTVVDKCGHDRWWSYSISAPLPLCRSNPALPISSKQTESIPNHAA